MNNNNSTVNIFISIQFNSKLCFAWLRIIFFKKYLKNIYVKLSLLTKGTINMHNKITQTKKKIIRKEITIL